MDAEESEYKATFLEEVGGEKGHNFSNDVFVTLYYNSFQIRELSPVQAFLYGITKYYVFLGLWSNFKHRKTAKNNERAYSLFKDRLRLLELIIDIRNVQHEEARHHPDKISYDVLISKITNASVASVRGYYIYIKPILKGLQEEGAVQFHDDIITVKPKAWKLVSDYYLEERRHKDMKKSQAWMIVLTLILALTSIGGFFKEEIRCFFGLG